MTALIDLFSATVSYADDVNNINLRSNVNGFVTNSGDTMRLFHLKIPRSINLNDIESLSISGMWVVPFALLRKLVKITEYGNYYYVPIHPNLLITKPTDFPKKFNDNYLPSLFDVGAFSRIKWITLKSSINFDFQLTVINRYYERDIRRYLIVNNHQYSINDYHLDPIIDGVANITSNACITGFFIETANALASLDPLNTIEIQMCGSTRLKYDSYEIITFGKLLHSETSWSTKHSLTLQYLFKNILPTELIRRIEYFIDPIRKYLYWIPLEPLKDWTETEFSSCAKLSNMHSVKVIIEPNMEGNVYTLEKKKLLIGPSLYEKRQIYQSTIDNMCDISVQTDNTNQGGIAQSVSFDIDDYDIVNVIDDNVTDVNVTDDIADANE